MTALSRRTVRELEELLDALIGEIDLEAECQNIVRIREKLESRKTQVLRIPKTMPKFCTKKVLVCEKFSGIPLADVVSREYELSAPLRKKLARKMLGEMLVQVFELGLFHGDPHAGNLILLDDGSVGLFDWGMTGELTEMDRHHIAAILKAIIAMDIERLIDALENLSLQNEMDIDRSAIKKELQKVIKLFKEAREKEKKPSFQELFEACLKGAAKLGIEVPDGLLMMAKSLVTIEGLAKGIDPQVSFKRVASPILFRAAQPGFADVINLSLRIPKMAMKAFSEK